MDRKRRSIEDQDTSSCDNLFKADTCYPTLTSVLSKTDDGIACYNLYKLREELENLLLSLRKKYSELLIDQSSAELLLNMKEEIEKECDIGEPKTPSLEYKTPERNKTSSENIQRPTFSARAKCKMQQFSKSQDSLIKSEFHLKSDVPKQQKNDTSNRFWSFGDVYCSDINMEDIKMLEKWIESHDQDSEYQDIPALETHYSSKWTEDDILEEIREGSKSVENPKGIDYSSLENSSGEDLFNRVKDESLPLNSGCPSLVHKLMSCLVHENIIASADVMAENIPENGLPENEINEKLPCYHTQVKDDTLESRLRRDLDEIGVLENTSQEDNDELLIELKQLQSLLIPVSKYNLQKKRELLLRAKAEMSRQEAQKRIQETDAKVMESYRAMSAARSKGKKMSKKEYYQIRTVLEEREMLQNSQ